MRHKRPTSIRILGKDWTITYVKQGNIDLEDYGGSSLSRLEISIQADLPESLEKETNLHETIHAIDHSLDLGMTEGQVNTLGAVLMQVFLDNPEFLKYLAK